MKNEIEKVAFGGGCFWCTEAVFLVLRGVVAVTPGYAGGNTENPTYQQVSSGKTGHVEVVLAEYDPKIISFEKLVEVFFTSHDATQLNGQGNDVGTQYRSILLYSTQEQKKIAQSYVQKIAGAVTEIVELKKFWPAEEYHKDYYAKHPNEGYPMAVIKPKVEKIKNKYKDILK
jgi:peptide-methionine (S)-S-oxide reductase